MRVYQPQINLSRTQLEFVFTQTKASKKMIETARRSSASAPRLAVVACAEGFLVSRKELID
jgi:hypothetical protein